MASNDKTHTNVHSITAVPDIDEKMDIVHEDILKQDAIHTSLIEEALQLREDESKLGLIQLFKLHYPGAMYGLALSLALVMEGYDTGLINNFFGQSAFLRKFGQWHEPTQKYIIPANWQAGVNNASAAGQIIGLFLNGWAQGRFGYRQVYIAGMLAMTATIFVLFFSQNLTMLLIGNLLCGIPWGLFQVITTAYASEIAPPALRGFLTTFVSMCWGTGAFLASGILRGSLDIPGNAGWQVPFALQWIWPAPLIVVAYFAPESPFYLIRKERYDEARAVVRKIARPGYRTDRMVEAQIEIMKQANEMEKLNAQSASFRDCFRGVNTKRTIIGLMAWLIQQCNGETLTGYTVLFLQNGGMPQTQAFNFNMGVQSVNLVATGTAMWLIGRVGRRPMYLTGIALMGMFMLIIGIVGTVNFANMALAVGVLLVMIRIVFKTTLGPCCYAIVSETPSSRVRGQSMVIGRAGYVAGGIVMNQLKPHMLAPDSWNWGAKAGYFFLGFDIAFFIYLYFYLPETRNRTTAEIEYLFQKRVPCRKFKKYDIDPYELAHMASFENVAQTVTVAETAKRTETA